MNRTQLNRIDSNVEVSKKRFNNTSKTNSKRAKTTSAH